MRRRDLLCTGAALFLAAGTPGSPRYIPLKSPVHLPLAALATEWQPFSFTMRFTKSDGRDSIAPGLAVRTPQAAMPCVICTYCPHEFCIIRLDQQQLRCPCHDSRFDPVRNGALLGGVAPHGAWHLSYRLTETSLIVEGIDADIERRLM